MYAAKTIGIISGQYLHDIFHAWNVCDDCLGLLEKDPYRGGEGTT